MLYRSVPQVRILLLLAGEIRHGLAVATALAYGLVLATLRLR